METKVPQIQENGFSKQCKSDEVIEVSDTPSPINIEINSTIHEKSTNENEFVFLSNEIQEEPIDLTFSRVNPVKEILTENDSKYLNPTKIIIQPKMHLLSMADPLLSGRGSKRKMEIPNVSNEEIIIRNNPEISDSDTASQTIFIPEPHPYKKKAFSYAIVYPSPQDLSNQLNARQQEILRMAKTIFSKRTRTLYHWMYPTASKQQIKQVVSSTWDSMSSEEKNIYIAQVLGRFGYANANLMINPQLGQIKELPPMPGIEKFNPKASELQNAISSITNETINIEQSCSTNIQSRKRSRITSKKVMQNFSNGCQEFDDDPELSQELAQFSVMFKDHEL